jgi:hydrogenase maturation protein HypF
VIIEVDGENTVVDAFLRDLSSSPPPLAHIDHITSQEILPNGYTTFQIIESESIAGEFVPLSPDIAICDDCRREMFDPSNPRYRYPFINCTNCGPRFTILRDIPYDRPATTMADFPCAHTAKENITILPTAVSCAAGGLSHLRSAYLAGSRSKRDCKS